MPAYRIISFDGGGIRGILSARLLQRLHEDVPGFLDRVDLFAGTSTGAILALGLAFGLTPGDLVDLYERHAADIFDDSWLDDLKDLGGLSGSDYDSRKLAKLAERVFGTSRLSQLRRRVLVPAFDLDDQGEKGPVRRWKPKYFHNFPGADSDGAERVSDVLLRATAAPTYFPSYQGFVDGGVVTNNPSMAAVAQAIDEDTGGQVLRDVRLLSIGTGVMSEFIEGQTLDWGYAQWAKPLVRLMVEGVMGVADYQCRRFLRKRYLRLDPVLAERIDIDQIDGIPALLAMADACDLGETRKWIASNFR